MAESCFLTEVMCACVDGMEWNEMQASEQEKEKLGQLGLLVG